MLNTHIFFLQLQTHFSSCQGALHLLTITSPLFMLCVSSNWSVRTVGVFGPFELHLQSFHANLEAVHRLDRRLSAGWVVKTYKPCEDRETQGSFSFLPASSFVPETKFQRKVCHFTPHKAGPSLFDLSFLFYDPAAPLPHFPPFSPLAGESLTEALALVGGAVNKHLG